MRTILMLLLCALSASAQIVTNGLRADYQAGRWILNGSGFITNWSDVHNDLHPDLITNDMVNTATFSPFATVDYAGRPIASFPNTIVDGSAFVLTCSNLSLHTRTQTVIAVCSGPNGYDLEGVLMWKNWTAFPWLGFNQGGVLYSNPPSLYGFSTWTTAFIPMNTAVFGFIGANGYTMRGYNHIINSGAANGAAAATHAELGGGVGSKLWRGELHRLLIYDRPMTTNEYLQTAEALETQYGIFTNFTKRVVCMGDSHTWGAYGSNRTSHTWRFRSNPELELFQCGIPSALIGTNGAPMSSNMMIASFPSLINKLHDSTKLENTLLLLAGGNDIGVETSNNPSATFGRLTNLVIQITNAKAWRVIVGTCANQNARGAITNYNGLIRENRAMFSGIADGGQGSRYDSSLENASDAAYMFGNGHPTPLGYAAYWKAFQEFINVPHRQTGFW